MTGSNVTRLCALTFVGVSACGGGNDVADAAGALDAGVGEDAWVATIDDGGPDADPVICTLPDVGSIWGRVYDQTTFDPVPGVRICVRNQPDVSCATSNGRGNYQIPCVPVGDAELSYEAAGYPLQLWAWTARYAIDEEVSLGLLRQADNTSLFAPTGQTFPDGARSMVSIDFSGVATGATVALRRGTGAGPYYTEFEGGTINSALTSIASVDEYAFLLAQAAAGEDEIEITVTPGPGATRCSQYYGGWVPTDSAPNTMRIPVQPDGVSIMFVTCE